MGKIIGIENLMKLDRDKLKEVPTREVKAAHLSEVMGEDVYIKIKALKGNVYYDNLAMSRSGNGKIKMNKIYEMQKHMALEAIVEPNLKDKELMAHFGAATPKELVEILIPGGDLTDVFAEIADLSGFGEDDEDDLKNE